jgi:hypothetical protein
MLQAAQDAGDAAAATTRQLPAHDVRLHCVDLADQFAAAGAKSGAVQTFDFSGAAAAAERSQVSYMVNAIPPTIYPDGKLSAFG